MQFRTRVLPWLVTLGCVSVALLAVAACEDDPTSGGNNFGFDASLPPIEAGPSVPQSDAGTPDAEAGAAPTVTVRVLDRIRRPINGVTVVFGNAEGVVLATQTTDATGATSYPVPSGGQVTLAMGALEGEANLLTVTSIGDNDEIVAIDMERETLPTPTLALGAAVAEPGSYRGYVGACDTGEWSSDVFDFSIPWYCRGTNPAVPVLLVGTSDGIPVSFQYSRGASLPEDGGTVTPVLGASSSDFVDHTVVASNLNPQPSDPSYRTFVSLHEVVSNTGVSAGIETLPQEPVAQSTFQTHGGFAEALQAEVSYRKTTVDGIHVGGVLVRTAAGGATSTNLDLDSGLPTITTPNLDATDSARPHLTWTTSSSSAAADATYAVVEWSGGTRGRWTFVVPPETTTIRAPSIPMLPDAPLPGVETSFAPPRILTVEASYWNGYADARKLAGTIQPPVAPNSDSQGGGYLPALPADGTVRFSALTYNGD